MKSFSFYINFFQLLIDFKFLDFKMVFFPQVHAVKLQKRIKVYFVHI